jgi:hypothetical protein
LIRDDGYSHIGQNSLLDLALGDRLPMTSRRAITTAVVGNFVIIAFAIILGLVTAGKPGRYFGEGRFTTALSCGQLLAVAFFSGRMFLARRPLAATIGSISAAWVWGFIAAGFTFLAADDAFEIHERLDRLTHTTFHIQETAWTDRLDDMIIAVYGLLGFSILWLFRGEILFFRPMRKPLAGGFVFLFASVVCDTISNDEQFLVWLCCDPATAKQLNSWFAVGDGAFTLLAEGLFLAAFYLSYRAADESSAHAREQTSSEGHRPRNGSIYSPARTPPPSGDR